MAEHSNKPQYPAIEDRPWLISYGRRKSRKLSPHKAALMETLMPRLMVRFAGDYHHPENQPAALATAHKDIWIEIGFGGGEHLAQQAANNPETLLIGCEPYIDGVAKLLVDIEARNLDNIRILAEDARLLLEALPENSVSRIFILFPDPWPKQRHQKRRIVSQQTLDLAARILKPGGELRLATDHVDYSEWMLEHTLAHSAFEWQAERHADWKTPPQDWVPTRYEEKTRAQGRNPVYFLLKRK
ncbi:MAG: tRNA (guanosine(46)-N7)-methyltransferase TrmB [Alphaproteobacteria bacterium]|nr:tRNA (guanosine(46)-N7)-methyltransferase TrmB [Alphaproteobacteria bacterium]